MTSEPAPSFDEWVDYCFTQGHQDFHTYVDGPNAEELEARRTRFVEIDPPVLASYVIKLFQNPEFIADRYSDDQIGDALWFLFGIASAYFRELRSETVDIATQIECLRSVEPFYLRLLDRVCCMRGEDPDGQYTDALEVDSAVMMIWDMDCIEGGVMFQDWPHLTKPGLRVLENVLMRCKTSTCMESALHGLGHIHHYHPQECKRIIDRFLNERGAPDWIRKYARDARKGRIL